MHFKNYYLALFKLLLDKGNTSKVVLYELYSELWKYKKKKIVAPNSPIESIKPFIFKKIIIVIYLTFSVFSQFLHSF